MIQKFADLWIVSREVAKFEWVNGRFPGDYESIFDEVVEFLGLDPVLTAKTEWKDYQGTMTFTCGQGDRRWRTEVDYGSCSGCGTRGWGPKAHFRGVATGQVTKDEGAA